ncbi:hypothetical protein BC830DRAFT_148094 [Chytriomyces sp. MP71]|nr:hypothetical protein BC830DRAFT_148094 [Chytriomyces sp. MP71]
MQSVESLVFRSLAKLLPIALSLRVNVLSTFDAAPSPTPASPTPKVLRRIGRSATDARSDLPRAAPTVTKEFHVLACVQCGADFLENDNFAYSCRFHKLEGGACCLKGNVACTSDAHRANHHTEYPYAAYATYVKEFFKFDHEVFGAVESQDVSYEPTIKCSVRVGVTCASHSTAPSHLFIFFTCGPSLNSKHLQLFDRDELTSNAADLELLIGRYEDADNVVEASWIVEDEQIIGIQMFAKSATMQRPSISRVLFEFESEGAKVPSVSTTTVLSESHFGEKANPKADTRLYPSLPFSAATYTNEDAVLLGIPKPRPPEKFQPVVKKGCPLKISFVSVDCFRSNPALGGDQFLIVVDIINDSLEPVKINEFICYWKIRDAGVDAAEWVQAKIAEDSISKSLDGWSQIAANKWATLKLFINVGKSGVVRIAPVLFDGEVVSVFKSTLTSMHS